MRYRENSGQSAVGSCKGMTCRALYFHLRGAANPAMSIYRENPIAHA